MESLYQSPKMVFDEQLPLVVSMDEIFGDPQWSHPIHAHNDAAEMVLITSGCGSLYCQNQELTTAKGDLLLLNMGVLHGESAAVNQPRHSISLRLTNVKFDGLPYNHFLPDDFSPVFPCGGLFDAVYALLRVLQDMLQQQPAYHIAPMQQILVCLFTLIRQILWNADERQQALDKNALGEHIKQYLDAHYMQSISLEDLASTFHFSVSHIAHIFKDHTGISINQYIIQRRIGEAQRLLGDTDLSITEIARRVGYDNLNHFYATFRKFKNYAPGTQRERSKCERIDNPNRKIEE